MESLENRALLAGEIGGIDVSTRAHFQAPAQYQSANLSGELSKLAYEYATVVRSWMESELQLSSVALARSPANHHFNPTDSSIWIDENDRVVVDASTTGSTAALAAALKGLGAEITGIYGPMVSAWLGVARLTELGRLAEVTYAKISSSLVTHIGSANTQGDVAMKADEVRSFLSLNGMGQKVGVISDSYDILGTASSDIASGDLPGAGNPLGNTTPVQVVQESSIPSDIDEGRAMLQLIHDIAPKAQLAFATANGGEAAFAQRIVDLRNAGATVIVDDAFYSTEPMFMDGLVAQAADTAVAAGVPYISAAGNSGRTSYEATTFVNSGTFFLGMPLHDFDPGAGSDPFQQITVAPFSAVKFTLQWQDPFASVAPGSGGATRDFDFLLFDNSPTPVFLTGALNNDVGGDPVEEFVVSNSTSSPVTLNVAIAAFSTSGTPQLKYVADNTRVTIDEYATNSPTAYGHPNAANVLAVGAANFINTPEFGVSPPQLQSSSSSGGIPILFDASGMPITPVTRQTPDVVGPDNVNTTFFGVDSADDVDTQPNFKGTSAAAPQVAALVALMKQASPSATPSQLFSALGSTAIDMGAAGYDNDSGFGLVQGPSALASIGGPYAVTFAGTTGSDTLLIRKDVANNIEFLRGGVLQFELHQSEITSITVNGDTGNDTLTVDYSVGTIGLSIVYNASSGTDTLIVSGYGSSAVNIPYANSAGGTIQVASLPAVSFNSVNVVKALGVNSSVSIQTPTIASFYTLGEDSELVSGLSQLSGPLPRTVFSNPAVNLTVTLGAAPSPATLQLSNMDNGFVPTGGGGFSAPVMLVGSSNADIVNIQSVMHQNGTGYNGVLVQAGGGDDTVRVTAPANVKGTLTIDGQSGFNNILEVSGYSSAAATATGTSLYAGSVQIAAFTPVSYSSMATVKVIGTNDTVDLQMPPLPFGPYPPGDTYTIGNDTESVVGRSQATGYGTTRFVYANPTRNLTVRRPSTGAATIGLYNMDQDFNPNGAAPFSAALNIVGGGGPFTSTQFNIHAVSRGLGLAYGPVKVENTSGFTTISATNVDAILGNLIIDGPVSAFWMTDQAAGKFYKLQLNPGSTKHRLNRADTLADFNAGTFNRTIDFVHTSATLDAVNGANRLDMYGESGVQETFTLGGANSAQVTSSGGGSFGASNFAEARVFSNVSTGGNDSLTLYGTSGNDTLTGSEGQGQVSGTVNWQYSGFKNPQVYGNGGVDVADFTPTADNDKLVNNPDGLPTLSSVTDAVAFYFGNTNTGLYNDNSSFRASVVARDFDQVQAQSFSLPNAWDRAFLTGTTGNDFFETYTGGTNVRYSRLTDASSKWIQVRNFGYVEATASSGTDTGSYSDTTNDWDYLEVPTWDTTRLILNSQLGLFFNHAIGFDLISVNATGYDGGKNDRHNTNFAFVNIVQPAFWDVV